MRALASISRIILLISVNAAAGAATPRHDGALAIGVARADITPSYPIRLCGYAARTGECQGVEQHLWAKALAIGGDPDGRGVAVLLTVDNCGVPASVSDEVAKRLAKAGVERDHFV